jgi:hypothetical protein
MSKKDKLIKRFKTLPKDFTFSEVVTLLYGFGFVEDNKGKTSGSRIRFYNKDSNVFINFHKPHPGSIMCEVALKDIFNILNDNNFINKSKDEN